MAKKKSNVIINTLVLLIVTFVCVAILAIVNQITSGPIEQAEIAARAETYRVVYPDAVAFAELDDAEDMLAYSPELLSSAGYDGCFINDVLSVTDESGEVVGYVVASTSPSGYGGDVQIAIGITKDGVLTGFNPISHSETPGFGAKCEEDDFKVQFAGKPASRLEYSKTGATADNEIDAISGATRTTNAVTEAVNAAIVFYQENFAGGVTDTVSAYTVDSCEETEDGYRLVVTTSKGYGGDIQIAVEIDNSATITSFKVLSSNETEYFGAKCTSSDYAKQFTGIKLDKAITTVPSGASTDNNEIDAISGATITTNAIDIAINGAVEYYNTELKGE